jgi:hypothetical protein
LTAVTRRRQGDRAPKRAEKAGNLETDLETVAAETKPAPAPDPESLWRRR